MSTISIPGFTDPFSSISHLLTAALGLFGSYFLIKKGRGNTAGQISLIIYSFCLVFLFSMSGVFHLLERGTDSRYVMNIMDYSAIFGMIAGTFTPLHIILFRGVNRWLVLILVWAFSITGLVLNAIFFEQIPEWLSYSIFLGLGWMGFVTMWKTYKIHDKKLALTVVSGGVAYSLGAILDFFQWPVIIPGTIGPHELFHILVMLAAFIHWKAIYQIADYSYNTKT